jgi:hypothetical protein
MDRFQPQPHRDVGIISPSTHQRAEDTLTDLDIRGTAMTKGWSLPIVELYGSVEVLWLSCVPWELTPMGHLSPWALKRLITPFLKIVSAACDPSRVARHLARIAPVVGSGAVWPEPPQAYYHR